MLYNYRAKLLRVIDGDTIHATVDYGFDQRGDYTFRLEGIDAPEMGTPEGQAAKEYLTRLLLEGPLQIETIKDRREKFGRYRAVLWVQTKDNGRLNVNQAMVRAGQAVEKTY